MNKQHLSFKIPRIKPRSHKALFDNDLPFQPKIEKAKKSQYNRRPKHRNTPDWDSEY